MTDRLVEKIKERIEELKQECKPFNSVRVRELEHVLELVEELEDGRRFGRDDLGRCRMRGCNLCDTRKAQLRRKWISINESLPELEKEVLVCTYCKRLSIYSLLEYSDGYLWEDQFGGWDDFAEVVAWQPLPPAWEGERHED